MDYDQQNLNTSKGKELLAQLKQLHAELVSKNEKGVEPSQAKIDRYASLIYEAIHYYAWIIYRKPFDELSINKEQQISKNPYRIIAYALINRCPLKDKRGECVANINAYILKSVEQIYDKPSPPLDHEAIIDDIKDQTIDGTLRGNTIRHDAEHSLQREQHLRRKLSSVCEELWLKISSERQRFILGLELAPLIESAIIEDMLKELFKKIEKKTLTDIARAWGVATATAFEYREKAKRKFFQLLLDCFNALPQLPEKCQKEIADWIRSSKAKAIRASCLNALAQIMRNELMKGMDHEK